MLQYKAVLFVAIIVLFAQGKKLHPMKATLNSGTQSYLNSSVLNLPNVDTDSDTIIILGTNDIHGVAYGRPLAYNGQKYQVGGFKLLSGLVDTLRSEANGNFFWLDAGDEYQGTYENSISDGNLTQALFNTLKPTEVALGNHEWDWGEDWLRQKLSQVIGYKYLVANLEPKEGVQPLPNMLPSAIISNKRGTIKLGVIGLTTLETPATTTGFPKDRFVIKEYLQVIPQRVKELKKKGAHAIILLTHVGLSCQEDPDKLRTYAHYTKDSPQGQCQKGEMAELLKQLPQDIGIDAIIAGHAHDTVHHWINSIPIMENPMSNTFANVLYLYFDKKTKKLIKDKTVIEGAIPLCSHVFCNQRCDMYVKSSANQQLTPLTYHGKSLHSTKSVDMIFDNFKYQKEVQTSVYDIVGESEFALKKSKDQDCTFGNILADMIKNGTNADFSVYGIGGIRAELDPGMISMYDIQKCFPFSTKLASVQLDGKTLKQLMTLLQEGKKGLYAMSGFKMTVEVKDFVRKVVAISKEDGSEINDDTVYTIGGGDFFFEGGDDFAVAYTQGLLTDAFKSSITYFGLIRDLFTISLREKKILTEKDLPATPRLKVIQL